MSKTPIPARLISLCTYFFSRASRPASVFFALLSLLLLFNLLDGREMRSYSQHMDSEDHIPSNHTQPKTSKGNEINLRDASAVLLHWKRTDNVFKIVNKLCAYSFDKILVWNNNPDILLDSFTFDCGERVRVYNSPGNLKFYARYLGCLQTNTPFCYFQDDDYFPPESLNSLYSIAHQNPDSPPVVYTAPEMLVKSHLEWCFYNQPLQRSTRFNSQPKTEGDNQPPEDIMLNTCFAWLGTGAFVSRGMVEYFLKVLSIYPHTSEATSHADNLFTTFLNQPPLMIAGPVYDMVSSVRGGYSDGREGELRNKRIIQNGVDNIISYLSQQSPSDRRPFSNFEVPPINYAVIQHLNRYLTGPIFNFDTHPYAQALRVALPGDIGFFISNIPILPSPDLIEYPLESASDDESMTASSKLEMWEQHLGQTWKSLEDWYHLYGYENAVWGANWVRRQKEHSTMSVRGFRSRDVVGIDEYVGLALSGPLNPMEGENVTIRFMIENWQHILDQSNARMEVSLDGYKWKLASIFTEPVCSKTRKYGTQPNPILPFSPLLSDAGRRLIDKTRNETRGWFLNLAKKTQLEECRLGVKSRIVEGGSGWRFFRINSMRDVEDFSWVVYDLGVEF